MAPSGTAAPGPIGTGFLPGPGWTVLQAGADATPERQALAVASNAPLHPEDSARGIRASSGLPYETLLRLPQRGVVIVALFTVRGPYRWQDEDYPPRELPLRVRDATRSQFYNVPVRPDRSLGQYQLRATVNDHYVDLYLYFGISRPSPELIATAQRQLDHLVVASVSAGDENDRQPSTSVVPSAAKIIDRTCVCTISPGNRREIDVKAQSGTGLFGDRSKWRIRPGASFYDARSTKPQIFAWMNAGWPPVTPDVGIPVRTDALSFPTRCRPSSTRVPLSTAGLFGGAASQFEDEYDCRVPQRILVRMRSVFYAPTTLRRQRTEHFDQLIGHGRVREGAMAIRTLSGKPIVLATVHESGKARLFVGNTCGPNG